MGVTVVANDVFVGDDDFSARGLRSPERVIVDSRLRTLLRRQNHPLNKAMDEIEADDTAKAMTGKRIFEIDADEALHSFILSEAVDTNEISAAVQHTKKRLP